MGQKMKAAVDDAQARLEADKEAAKEEIQAAREASNFTPPKGAIKLPSGAYRQDH